MKKVVLPRNSTNVILYSFEEMCDLKPCIFRKMKHNVNKIICVLWLLNVTRIKNLSRMRKILMMFCLKGYYYG